MESQVKRLIAVGASVTANCLPCLQYLVGKALEDGVDQQEISEAIEIGKTVRKGAATKMDRFVLGLDYAPLSAARTTNAGWDCASCPVLEQPARPV